MSVHLARPLSAAGNAFACARFIAKVCGSLFRRTEMLDDGGPEPELLLKDTGLKRPRFSGSSLEDKWREELALLAREQSGRD